MTMLSPRQGVIKTALTMSRTRAKHSTQQLHDLGFFQAWHTFKGPILIRHKLSRNLLHVPTAVPEVPRALKFLFGPQRGSLQK